MEFISSNSNWQGHIPAGRQWLALHCALVMLHPGLEFEISAPKSENSIEYLVNRMDCFSHVIFLSTEAKCSS